MGGKGRITGLLLPPNYPTKHDSKTPSVLVLFRGTVGRNRSHVEPKLALGILCIRVYIPCLPLSLQVEVRVEGGGVKARGRMIVEMRLRLRVIMKVEMGIRVG